MNAACPPVENSCDAKIPQLDHPRLCEEDVLSLDVSVENLPVMNMFQPETYLNKPVQDLRRTGSKMGQVSIRSY